LSSEASEPVRVFYDEDADPRALEGERIAILGYGIQGRAQALTLRDSGVDVRVGNRDDAYRDLAREDGIEVLDVAAAVSDSTIAVVLLPDEIQPEVYRTSVAPGLEKGNAVVFAHGFAVRYGKIEPSPDLDLLLLAPRMPGQFLRARYLEGWGIPAFVDVARDASGRAWTRLLGLARALGVTRCGAVRASFEQETELDLFSEHFTYPLMFRALETAFDELVDSGYPEELALMELHGSEELGEVFLAAAREGLFGMLASHASPACQSGIAHHWESALSDRDRARHRAQAVLDDIRSGRFADHLMREAQQGYPELARWKASRPARLARAERRLSSMLRRPLRR
jgi:ketol-acid reductoisomerase